MGASREMVFQSNVRDARGFSAYSEMIPKEPSFTCATVEFALKHGGPITRSFLSSSLSLDPKWEKANFISRVHRFNGGDLAACSGFHLDAPPNPSPTPPHDYDFDCEDMRKPELLLGIVGTTAPTRFAVGDVHLPPVPSGSRIFPYWDGIIRDLITSGVLQPVSCSPNRIYAFDNSAFHEAVVAKCGGYRWFGRLLLHDTYEAPFMNELRSSPFPTMTPEFVKKHGVTN